MYIPSKLIYLLSSFFLTKNQATTNINIKAHVIAIIVGVALKLSDTIKPDMEYPIKHPNAAHKQPEKKLHIINLIGFT